MSAKRSVEVFLNGQRLIVPERADCHWAARGALGLPRGMGVARESDPAQLLEFEGGQVFVAHLTRRCPSGYDPPMSDQKLNAILSKLEQLDYKVSNLSAKVDNLDQKFDRLALKLLASEECDELGVDTASGVGSV